uniref:Membrane protein insertase YidC n=1 Tax=Toxocara canis TaxID=6265 RepID=A0A183V2X5_TOXCA
LAERKYLASVTTSNSSKMQVSKTMKGVKAQPTFFKDGCSQRLAQILGEHLLLLSLNSAALAILSIFNVFYVCTHRKTQSTKEEEVEPTVVIPPPVEVVGEQTPQSINPTISH